MGHAALRKGVGGPSLHLKTYHRHGKKVKGQLWRQGWTGMWTVEDPFHFRSGLHPQWAQRCAQEDTTPLPSGSVWAWCPILVFAQTLFQDWSDPEVFSSDCLACVLKEGAKNQGRLQLRNVTAGGDAHWCAKNFTGSSKATGQEAAERPSLRTRRWSPMGGALPLRKH